MQDACNILLKRYRQTNARARTSPAPYYFQNSFTFDADVVRPPEAISEDEQRLSGSYETAMKDFSDIARQNDATVQSLRTGEIRRREFYFNKLERDVRERLVRELILQLKLGGVERRYFREKFDTDVVESFAVPFDEARRRGWLRIGDDAVTLTREGLVRVDRWLPAFYLPEHQNIRYS